MATLHIENTVRDFDTWKTVFDKFERFRQDNGVRSYRVTREVGAPNAVAVDLDFDSLPEAENFLQSLRKIWETPQSQAALIDHRAPKLLDVVAARAF